MAGTLSVACSDDSARRTARRPPTTWASCSSSATIIAALFASPLGSKIAERTKELICQIGGMDCSAETQQALSQCVVAEATDKLTVNGEVNVRLVKVKLEGGVEYVRQKRADGTVAVTIKLPVTRRRRPEAGQGAGGGQARRHGQGRVHAAGHVPAQGRRGGQQVRPADQGLHDRRGRRPDRQPLHPQERSTSTSRPWSRWPTRSTRASTSPTASTRAAATPSGTLNTRPGDRHQEERHVRQAQLRRHHGLLPLQRQGRDRRRPARAARASAARWRAT